MICYHPEIYCGGVPMKDDSILGTRTMVHPDHPDRCLTTEREPWLVAARPPPADSLQKQEAWEESGRSISERGLGGLILESTGFGAPLGAFQSFPAVSLRRRKRSLLVGHSKVSKGLIQMAFVAEVVGQIDVSP
jgi:hypothetical protein